MVESSRTMVGEQTGDAPVRDRSNLMLLVLCSAAFMAMLDVFVVSVAFAAIGEGYPGSSLADLSWVLNAYTIVYAALLIPAGRLADRYGRRAGFVVGLVVFTVASLACALGPTLWWLVGFRVLQAVGAAALTPTSLGLLLTALPPERRATAVKIWATSTSLAAAVGPVIGGALVKVSWQWVFLINVPVGIAAVVGAVVLLPETKDATVTRIPDVLGAAVLAVALGSLALALVKGQEWGWSGTGTLTAFAVAVVGLAAVAVRMRRHPAPVVDPALLRVRSFFWSNVTALLFCTAFGAVLLSVILRLQTGAHYSALVTGLAVAPSPLMVPIFAAVSQRLSNRLAPSTLVAIGNVLVGVGVIMLAVSATEEVNYATQVLPGWLLVGVGVGFSLPNLLAKATVDLPPARVSTGSAVVNTSRQMGYVLGVSMLVAILGEFGSADAETLAVFTYAWWAIAVVALASAATAMGMRSRRASGEALR
ncbi:major facilitator transporter [Rhodococcus ruber Chol-4]|uniref:DHA2 family efflux MFS transporter permease subunit n=2 Tax=Nocardiaceae TaxID=85025 RepID=UPI0005C250CD|nr:MULTISPECIES: DHA2 family efflux MFS transporter permease subunit [Rhodococcus]MDO2377304.1 DHA2 family efflux MFS transporter permease subunit [Rhodococcus ruber]AUM16834.1 MFS transporter [Rhodococcus ruber]AWG97612.1 MFS transporter [Rhodococcus ruber]KXF86077.1 major facilitator transporter [Rhodococcus ruber Chol-4]MCZ1073178.1 DHA2 family efflux MFS transporter permease subunit [Rhodococcus sp. A5(2022)]